MKLDYPKEILLVLFSVLGRVVGRTKLQKLVYLLKREQNIDAGLDFQVYFYGPFSRDLNNNVDELIQLGLLDVSETFTRSGDKCYEYSISSEGMKFGMNLLEKLPKNQKEKILQHIAKFNLMTPSEIVKYVYAKYPEAKPPEH